MIFNKHSDFIGLHAFLCASKASWINYTPEKLDESYRRHLAIQRGTDLHEFAEQCIKLRRKQPKTKDALNMYVNDAIGYRMSPEQVLFYSINVFGTADAISFKDDLLRIHDLKTGVGPVSMNQLLVYASLFCLEYDANPLNIRTELRIYHFPDEVIVHNPDPQEIMTIAEKIVEFDKIINKIKLEEE